MTDKNTGYKTSQVDMERLVFMLTLKVPKTDIAKALGIGRTTLYRMLEELHNE